MKLTLAIPVMNQLEDTKGVWYNHVALIQDKNNTELLVINNNSTDGTVDFLEKKVFPWFPDHKIVNNSDNMGVLKSMNQCIKESKGDVIAILHNDVYVLEPNWDVRILQQFEQIPKLGLAGFLGAQGSGWQGGRMNTVSNLLEAEIHGARERGQRRVAIFDGFSLIGRRKMFEEVGGFDESYAYHHFYDRDISLLSHYAGWENWMIGVFCHHESGVTANRPDYQIWIDKKYGVVRNGDPEQKTGDRLSYNQSEEHFINKWKGKLPIMVQ